MDVRHDRDGVTEPSNIDVAGIDAAMITQKQQYGGTPVGQIILRPGEDLATMVWGCLLLLASFCFFVLSIYAMLVSEHMPDTGIELVDAIKRDQYYCYLVPFTLPVFVIFVVSNWVSLKFFRHN